ncbi:S8 family peptidase [Emticicia agri]|uniref:Peptidase S8/S53 domain-containing protein n=1 Tax=Emticicia agri TaxID=2492393 RepID=A0A4Q5M3W7_9BACT|nr:S8 family serine peptidase [Emticicia agri]RYU97028.1 hypothetical protein EWM59_03710 [Emticicia agri]
MKKNRIIKPLQLIILLIPLIYSSIANAQNDDTLFVKDELYVKLKDSQPFQQTLTSSVMVSSVSFLQKNSLSSMVSNAELPFYFSNSPKLLRTYRLKISEPKNIDKIIAELSKDSAIEYAERIPKVFHNDWPDDTDADQNVYFSAIQMTDVWEHYNFIPNQPAKVAIVDDAVQVTHPDLSANVDSGWDVADHDNNPNPPNGILDHGTHVAGIAGAVTDNNTGMASIGNNLVKIIAVKASFNTTTTKSIDRGYEGVVWAANSGASIINCSWGNYIFNQTNNNIIQDAINKGILVIAAAGNDDTSNPHYPSSYPGVWSVASTNPYVKSDFSNYGSRINISAPGNGIYSTIPMNDYEWKGGTSMASPMVAGLAGLLKGIKPSLTASDIKNIIASTADNIDIYNPGYIGQLGAGQINAFKAVKTLCPELSTISYVDTPAACITLTTNTCTGCSFSWKKDGNNIGTNSNSFVATQSGIYTVRISKNNCYSEGEDTVELTIPTNSPVASVQNGNWNTASTWQCGIIPDLTRDTEINHVITINGITAQANKLIYNGGTLNMVNNGLLRLNN